MTDRSYYLGCAQWQHTGWAHWQGRTQPLRDYAQQLSCVEGNTTFYGMPDERKVASWVAQSPEDFRFVFKLPQQLTHQAQLLDVDEGLHLFFDRLTPLRSHMGPVLIQLPASAGPEILPRLSRCFDLWPAAFSCAVEVRHPAFFAKGEAERQLNRLLMSRGVDRVMLDSRALFAPPLIETPENREALSKKPRLPLHVLATGQNPIIRFIGHWQPEVDQAFWAQWWPQLMLWIKQGKTPWFFVHSPSNADAPERAQAFHRGLVSACEQKVEEIPPLGEGPSIAARVIEQSMLF